MGNNSVEYIDILWFCLEGVWTFFFGEDKNAFGDPPNQYICNIPYIPKMKEFQGISIQKYPQKCGRSENYLGHFAMQAFKTPIPFQF